MASISNADVTPVSVSTDIEETATPSNNFPREYRFKVQQDCIRSFKDPHNSELQIHHVYLPVREFAHGLLPDDVNPRSHEKVSGRVPGLIEASLKEQPTWFHLLNRGELILAQRCWYDNQTKQLHIVIDSAEEGGLADGATTDRVIAKAKREIAADLSKVPEHELPDYLRDAHIHLEIISGSINEMLVPLTGARNTSNQVKEFALENLGGGFDWLKELIEGSEFAGRVRYRENDPQPVDIRTVLGLLTLFHPKWNELGREPVVAFSSKGLVLDYFRDSEWKPGFEALKPVVLDILRLHESIQLEFQGQYNKYKGDGGGSGKLGKRKEIRYSEGKTFTLALSQAQTKYLIPDGWLYPILASFRQLLVIPQTTKESVSWITDVQVFFTEHGYELVADVVEQSQSLGSNPNAVGKSRPLWNNLRKSMELHRMKIEHPV
jgi:hypothetical protein